MIKVGLQLALLGLTFVPWLGRARPLRRPARSATSISARAQSPTLTILRLSGRAWLRRSVLLRSADDDPKPGVIAELIGLGARPDRHHPRPPRERAL
jgi:hypothetical protein